MRPAQRLQCRRVVVKLLLFEKRQRLLRLDEPALRDEDVGELAIGILIAFKKALVAMRS